MSTSSAICPAFMEVQFCSERQLLCQFYGITCCGVVNLYTTTYCQGATPVAPNQMTERRDRMLKFRYVCRRFRPIIQSLSQHSHRVFMVNIICETCGSFLIPSRNSPCFN